MKGREREKVEWKEGERAGGGGGGKKSERHTERARKTGRESEIQ